MGQIRIVKSEPDVTSYIDILELSSQELGVTI
jgi:hypothetical protein